MRGRQRIGAVLFFNDVTEARRNAARIEFLAHHDPLTSLANRLLAEQRFAHHCAEIKEPGGSIAVLFLDLDGFKHINDTLGHESGDRMLQAVADRLQQHVAQDATVSRVGGDEFVVLLPELTDRKAATAQIESLLQALAQPYRVGPHPLSASVSIGASFFPDDGPDFATLVKKADTAMYQAKDAGRNTWRAFETAMGRLEHQTLHLRGSFLDGLQNNEFVLHDQPQLRLADNRLIGAEALVRWKDANGRLIPPAHFIALAESSGMIVPLGEWVLRKACRQAVQWQALHPEPLVVAVNISAIQFKRGLLEQTVAAALHESGLPPHLLELELTESTLLTQTEMVLATMHRLRELGVRLSIDDFGTGYSSLAYLKRLEVNKLKIDRSFIDNLTASQEDSVIVKAIIEMARSLKLQTLAEGVEQEAVLDYLRELKCDEVQGYVLARPLPAADFLCYLAARPERLSPAADTMTA
ncbi:putative bifunctional diguanylate cyclase/phosphodiesterase [Paludibacterium yongneupense]|uniref:putative bifunctional diguanylate cyclase/phosphodiesterase n=1 Tax=Paludibacterium yongneupense TaxID=400061 RepID=UPI0006857F38|nr:EAL domain-containing protein [Paludibacterium yongneupense]